MNCGNQKENTTYISNIHIEMYTNQFNSNSNISELYLIKTRIARANVTTDSEHW